MTKFITYFNLCSIQNRKDFLGIAPDRENGNVITTIGKSIVIIKISTQKNVRCWTVLEKLSAKVVYDRHSEKYVAVFGMNALRCWDESIQDINKCKKLKFQKAIDDLVSAGEHTYVLYKDGTCEELSTAIQSRKEQVNPSTQQQLVRPTTTPRLTDASVRTLVDGSRILTYFEKDSKSGDMELVLRPLRPNINAVRYKLKRENGNVCLVGYAVIDGDGTPILFTIWSDDRIFLLNLSSTTPPEKSPGNFVSKLNALKTDSPLTLLGISSHLVAIYGANIAQEGASLLLYNTQFKVVKAKQLFKVHFIFSRLWALEEHLLLAMGENLSVVSYRNTKDLLAELIGSQTDDDFESTVETDDFDEEDSLLEGIEYASDELETEEQEEPSEPSSKRTKAKTNVVEADGKTVPFQSIDTFNSELDAINKMQMHVEVVEVDSDMEDMHIALMSNYNDDGFHTPAIEMIVRQMESSGASEHEITEKLLTVLIKADLMPDIAVCLRRYTNISDKMLAKTLCYVLEKYALETLETIDDTDTNKEHTNGDADVSMELNIADDVVEFSEEELSNADILVDSHQNEPAECKVVDVLNAVLACTFEPDVIEAHVRREIDYKKVVTLLEHLYNLLADDSAPAFEERPGAGPACIQFEMQVLRWFGVLLNTNFQKLALSKNLHIVEVLFKWHTLFEKYKREAAELQLVGAMLYNIVQRKKVSTEKNYSKWYSIEEVQLY